MRMPGFLQRLFPGGGEAEYAVRAPALEALPANPPRGEQAEAERTLFARLGAGFTPWNPDELVRHKGREVYRRMLRDDQVSAAYDVMVSAIVNRPWHFELAEDTPRQQEIRDFFEYTVERTLRGTFTGALKVVLKAKWQGVSVSEKIYQPTEFNGATRWGLRAVKAKPYHTFIFHTDEYGNLTRLQQEVNARRIDLDARKFVIHVNRPELDPIWGESDLRRAYRAYWEKDNILKFWNIYLERIAGGLVQVRPAKEGGAVITASEKTDLDNILRDLMASSAVRLPAGFEMEVHMPPSTEAFEKACEDRDRRISRALLMPNLLGYSPQGDRGSLSQSRTQLPLFFKMVAAEGDVVADTLNEQLFRELAWWNYGEREAPLLRFDHYTDEQKLEIAKQFINAVNNEAVIETLEDENRLRELLDFPERDEDAEPIRVQPEPGAPERDPDEDDDAPAGNPGAGRRGRSGGEGGRAAAPGRRRSRRGEMAAFEVGRTPPWRKRVNFARLALELDDLETRFAESLAAGVEVAWQRLREGLAEILAELGSKPDMDRAVQRVGEAIPPDARRQLQAAAVAGIRGGYGLGRETAQDELDEAAARAPDMALTQRLRFAIGQTSERALRIGRKDGPADAHSFAAAWSVADFAEGIRLDTAERYFAAKGFQISGGLSEELRKQAEAVLLQGIANEKSIREIVAELEPLLKDVIGERDAAGRRVNIGARLNTIARTNLAEAFNQAQLAVYTDPDLGDFVRAYEYSAILDSRTTDFCRRYDGHVLLKDDPEWNRIVPPNHFNCRSRLIPVTAVDEFEPDSALPIEPAPGFGGTT